MLNKTEENVGCYEEWDKALYYNGTQINSESGEAKRVRRAEQWVQNEA